MRKKRQGKVSHDRWLVSYADFITLLFAFFVVLFATGQSDRRKKVEMAASIQSAFNQMGIFQPHPEQPNETKLIGTGGSAAPPSMGPTFAATPESMVMVRQHIEQVSQPEIGLGVIAVHESPNGLVISLQEAGFFDSGAAGIRSSALPVLDRIADALPQTLLRVEGHTDNVPIHTAQFASNWELSSSRASSIARLLLLHSNVHAENMSVAGYAEFHPATSNDTADGRARNRRVDIVLLADGR
ncbi:MAG: OmpA family protein [Acidobacteriota bacterium]|nr:OmpA family protein [Acidobacteriota bacterium]